MWNLYFYILLICDSIALVYTTWPFTRVYNFEMLHIRLDMIFIWMISMQKYKVNMVHLKKIEQ